MAFLSEAQGNYVERTSAPGIEGTGKTGWVEEVSGRETDIREKKREGFGIGGHI